MLLTQKPPCAGPGQMVEGEGPRPLWPLSPRPLSHPASPLLALLSRLTDNIPGRAAGLLAGPSSHSGRWDQFQCTSLHRFLSLEMAALAAGHLAESKAGRGQSGWAEGAQMLCRVRRQAGWGECPQGPQRESWPGWQDQGTWGYSC